MKSGIGQSNWKMHFSAQGIFTMQHNHMLKSIVFSFMLVLTLFSNVPAQAKFLSADPVGFVESGLNPQMFNRYSYSLNDPVNRVDPDGRCSKQFSGSQTLCGIQDAITNALVPVIENAMEAAGVEVLPEELRDPEGTTRHTAGPISSTGEMTAIAVGVAKAGADRVNPGKKLSKVSKETKTETVGGKFTKKTKVVPGKGPGQSRAEIVTVKNQKGETIRTHKDSFDRAGKFQHRKPLRGGPEGRPQDDTKDN